MFYENYLTSDFHTNTVILSLFALSSLSQKYLHVVAKEDPQARTVGGRAVHDGSQL